ncbi:MAG: IS4 family transposase [Gemmataceae bacterium]
MPPSSRPPPKAPSAACEHPGVVLVLHDATVLDYSGLDSIPDLGQVGDGRGRGLYAHNSLAVTPSRQVLGLAWQVLHRRRKVKKGETKAQRQRAPDRESRLWKNARERIPVAPDGRLWVDIADRGSDVTEFLAYEHRAGRAYVIRSQHNRKALVEQAGGVVKAKLHDHVRGLTSGASQPRRARHPGHGQKAGPRGEAGPGLGEAEGRAPRQPRGEHDDTPLEVYALRVWEIDPPAGEKGIEWVLLTNVAVADEEDAWRRVDWYSARWVIEEWHKGMKTGCAIEDLQFTKRASLEPAIAVLSVVAVWLLQRDASRDEERASSRRRGGCRSLWVRVLSGWRHKRACPGWTYGEFVEALARLGGHQNRKHDHPPGWLVLWRGWRNCKP